MNKKILYYLLTTSVLISCKKTYKYVEKNEKEAISGGIEIVEEEKEIKAENDTIAYIEAFKKFIVSEKVSNQMRKSNIRFTSIPLSFKVYDENGNDITNISFKSREKREIELTNLVLESSSYKSEKIDTNKIDSSKIKNLQEYFSKKKDEFSTEDKVWYQPKSAPKYTNQNGIYCYFQTLNNVPSNLRFRVQYYSDEWLFIKKIQFSIDGKAYEYIPLDLETDSGDGGYIWEWFDESISDPDKELIKALAHAKNAKIKFIGRQYYDTKILTKSQIEGIRRTIELYKAMGGNF
ncbi:hypothetical protein VUJ46_06070 [Chryseobacterium sp. MYb264]|uniref:hypothetical protein n=1 Tax=Chryseobacterium sp. MYb264 TaxID=2745153 RepID=UPI002E156D27|nr:hypothetical protein VUJ46_06070 [Chryseobacterium sp. MYb264]